MVGDDDDLVAVPDLGVLAEVLLEDADGAGAADVVRHEDVDVDPDVVAGLDGVAAGVAGQDLFGQGHRRHVWLAPVSINLTKWHYIESTQGGHDGLRRPVRRPPGRTWAEGYRFAILP